MAFDIQQWLVENSKDEVIFDYKGEVLSDLIADSLDEIEVRLPDAPSRAKKKIYNILVECLQNLFHHSAEVNDLGDDMKGKYAICILSRNNLGYQIKAGNFIYEKQRLFLTKHLDKINTLDKESLKDLYKEILNNQEFSEKGGGGLGMVDMARKSGSKLEYYFKEHNSELHFFSLQINILDN